MILHPKRNFTLKKKNHHCEYTMEYYAANKMRFIKGGMSIYILNAKKKLNI